MKVIFEIDTEKEDAQEYLKLINEKAKAYIGINAFCELYRMIYNRKFYSDDILLVQKSVDPLDPIAKPIEKEWISIDFIEQEMEKIFDDLKDFQYWE